MSDGSPPARPFRPLSRRVVAWVLLYSSGFTLLMAAALIGVHYTEERELAMTQLRFAAASYSKSLATSLWEIDMPAARLQLDALANFPMVGHVVLRTAIGQEIRAGEQAQQFDASNTRELLSLKETLVSPDHPEHPVGQLQLYVDQHALLHHLQTDAIRILGAEALKGLALALLIAWLTGKLVTRHVAHMAQHVAALHPAALDHTLVLQRHATPYRDELDQLSDAFNQLNRHLADHIGTQRALEEELRGHRDRLTDMVAERTDSLERLKGFHSLIIRVLTRFINLPLGQANAAVDHGLAAFGEYFETDRCLLFTHNKAVHGFHIANAWPPVEARGAGNDIWLAEDALPPALPADHASRIWISAHADTAPADDHLLARLATRAYTIVGVEVKGDTIGLLCLVGKSVPVGSDNASLLELAARVAANMLDHKAAQMNLLETQEALQRANHELQLLSRHDPLTGLANRRYFDEVKEIEFRRASRSGSPLSVLMCDLDEFKRYNDTYGHAQGDRCLIALSNCIRSLFARAGELPARLGGEEFAIILPNIYGEQAFKMAERVRLAVWALNLPHAESSVADRVTISIGVACLKHGTHENFDKLLQQADDALYRAKENRNWTAMAD